MPLRLTAAPHLLSPINKELGRAVGVFTASPEAADGNCAHILISPLTPDAHIYPPLHKPLFFRRLSLLVKFCGHKYRICSAMLSVPEHLHTGDPLVELRHRQNDSRLLWGSLSNVGVKML